MQNNKQAYIDFIIDELNKGNVQYKDVCLVFLSKFKLTEPTFVKYWKRANETHTEQRRAVESAKLIQTIQEETKAVTRQILTKNEALEIITAIAKGNARRVKIGDKEQVLIPTENERLKAIEIGAKIEGWNAPKQIEDVTNKVLTYEELKQQLKDLGIEEE